MSDLLVYDLGPEVEDSSWSKAEKLQHFNLCTLINSWLHNCPYALVQHMLFYILNTLNCPPCDPHTHLHPLSVRMELGVNWPSAISSYQAGWGLSEHCLLALKTKLSSLLRGRLITWLPWIKLILTGWWLINILLFFFLEDVAEFLSRWVNILQPAWLIYEWLLGNLRHEWQTVYWLTDWLAEWLIYKPVVCGESNTNKISGALMQTLKIPEAGVYSCTIQNSLLAERGLVSILWK